MSKIYFATLLIPKLIDDNKTLEKNLRNITKEKPRFRDDTIIFKIKPSHDEYELAENVTHFQKLGKTTFEVKICRHGFVVVETNTQNKPDADAENVLMNYVINRIENSLNHCPEIFEYEKSLTQDEVTKTIQKNFVRKSQTVGSKLVQDVVANYCNELNGIIKQNYKNYSDKSLIRENQIGYAETLFRLYKIVRGHYLRLFHSTKKCSLIDSTYEYDRMTSDIGNILESNRSFFDLLINPPYRFVEENKDLEVFVISIDIEKFTQNIVSNFHENIDEQKRKFSILTKKIKEWLQVNEIPIREYWYKCIGDGYMYAFKNSVNTYDMAIGIQKKLLEERIPVRIGLSGGTVGSLSDIWDREELIGPGMNMANRIMSLGDGNHILASTEFIEKLKQNEGKTSIPGANLGECIDKHGMKLNVYNIFSEDYGNKEMPYEIKKQQEKPT